MNETGTNGAAPVPIEGREIRPDRIPFLLPYVAPLVLLLAFLTGFAGVAGVATDLPFFAVGAVAGFLVGCGIIFWAASITWGKERYQIHSSHIICRRGTVFSDQATELDVRNITHVKLRLPWLRHKFFGTGDVMIDSAGSGSSEINLRSIARPELAYDAVRELMQQNGYSLRQEKLLHEERPDLIGVLIDCLGMISGGIVVIAVTVSQQLGDSSSSNSPESVMLMGVIGGVVLLGLLAGTTLHYLDMRRRIYRVHEDVVVYEEGFLTRDNAFMPSENIADGSTKRTLVDQIVGLYDVQVSCQGSGQEIRFRRLRRGQELAAAIDQVVADEQGRSPPSSADVPASVVVAAEAPQSSPGLPELELVPAEEAWTTELRMRMGRALLGTVPLLVIFPLLPIAIVTQVIRVMCTRFSVRSASIRSTYRFLTMNEREFAYDKITAVVTHRNPFDRLLGTFSMQIWSIGAPQPMDIPYLRRDDVNLPAFLRQVGIASDDSLAGMPTRFNLLEWTKARLPVALFLAVTIAGLGVLGELVNLWFHAGAIALGAAAIGGLLYSHLYYARQRLDLHSQHVAVQTGVIVRSHYRARYRNVKKVVQTRYPFTDVGSIQLFIAGERSASVQANKTERASTASRISVPYSLTVCFIEDFPGKLALLDRILAGRIPTDELVTAATDGSTLAEGRPALANRMTLLLFLSTLLFPCIVLLPFTIPWLIVDTRRRSYRVERGRVVSRWGILYRRQATIQFDRIDSLRNEQGFLGKIFKNGNVTLFTAGSSSPDLVLRDLQDYQSIYAAIRQNYGRG